MLLRYNLLILLILVLSLCGATKYYIRPTEPTNTSCLAQPYLTLSQYINDSDHYFKSNTVFKFLPGTHHMDQPLHIRHVHNMSLENSDSSNSKWPHLVPKFSCENQTEPECIYMDVVECTVCRAAIQLYNSHNVTIGGISITLQASNVSGIIVQYASNMYIQLISLMSHSLVSRSFLCENIILISDSNEVEVYSSDTANFSNGFQFQYINNTLITNITAMYNEDCGICFSNTTNTTVSSPQAMYNDLGLGFNNAINTTIISPKAIHNGFVGVWLWWTINTIIVNAFVVHNDGIGVGLKDITCTIIISPTAMFSGLDGITLFGALDTDIVNATLMHNGQSGVIIFEAINARIINTSIPVNSEVSVTVSYILVISSSLTKIHNSSFSGIGAALNAASTADPTTHPAVLVLYDSELYVSGCNFTGNRISAVKAYRSYIVAAGDLIFSNNRALAGSAFILIMNSILRLTENSCIFFSNNHAINTREAFHVKDSFIHNVFFFDNVVRARQSTCFLNIEGKRSQVRLVFVNNSAGKGGDTLYGGQVALGTDGDWNCLESFRNISNISQNGLSLITSDPSQVCLCNETGKPDCLTLVDPTPRSIYPGQSFNLSAVVVGQQFGTVAGTVYAQFLRRSTTASFPQMDKWQGSQSATQEKCTSLKFTVFFQNETSDAVLALTATNKEFSSLKTKVIELEERLMRDLHKTVLIYPMNNPVYVNISILSCSPGFMFTTHPLFSCGCNQLLHSLDGVSCHIHDQTIRQSGLIWVGMVKHSNGTVYVAASEYCSFDYCNRGESNVKLSEPDSQCNYNHSGILCGGCQPGLSLALGSAQCLPCSNKYLALLIPFVLAGPALVFFIKLLDLTISQGTLNGLIFYANIVRANEYIFIPRRHTNPLTLFIAWLDLDLGVETCFFHGLTAYTKTWLQFVFPVYIWSIAGLIIVIAKYSDRVAKVMGNNSVPVLATLFLLSYAKLFRTIIKTLSYTMLYSSQGQWAVWSGNVDYLGSKHAPLFAVAVASLLFLWLPYTLLLLLGQWLHRCNCQFIDRRLMDAHYGPLKGKHHYWFGTLLLVRAVVLLMSTLIPANHSVIVNFCVSLSATLLIFLGMFVYQYVIVAIFNISFIMNLLLPNVTILFTTIVKGDQIVANYTLIGIGFVEFFGLILFKVVSILKRSDKLMACLHRRQPVEDDWELYEEAERQREMESYTKEEDSDEFGSIESLPTY